MTGTQDTRARLASLAAQLPPRAWPAAEGVATNPRICGGHPCLTGTRWMIGAWGDWYEYLADDHCADEERARRTDKAVRANYPHLSAAQIATARAYYLAHRPLFLAAAPGIGLDDARWLLAECGALLDRAEHLDQRLAAANRLAGNWRRAYTATVTRLARLVLAARPVIAGYNAGLASGPLATHACEFAREFIALRLAEQREAEPDEAAAAPNEVQP